ncbi:MAG: type I 3-dehydroquinate dehydratase [Candidatus Kapabacteria bacterium]|nr:type I 3-dehydroquinate dehydratase [Ignavibacteriota bacterium]MCW5886153.1 type I 3-dehydroquinate dehydratase [Candidatus Kapabacteria bacterium]
MICVSIGNIELDEFEKLVDNFDLIEIRLDLFNAENLRLFEKYLLFAEKLIITARLNGKDNIEHLISAMVKAVENRVRYIDIDINEIGQFSEIIKITNKKYTNLILSYHDFDKTPNDEHIEDIISMMQAKSADIFKLCFKMNSTGDIIRTFRIYNNHKSKKIIAFNLGQDASLTRLLALQMGATFVYAALDENSKTENSQLIHTEMEELIRILNL